MRFLTYAPFDAWRVRSPYRLRDSEKVLRVSAPLGAFSHLGSFLSSTWKAFSFWKVMTESSQGEEFYPPSVWAKCAEQASRVLRVLQFFGTLQGPAILNSLCPARSFIKINVIAWFSTVLSLPHLGELRQLNKWVRRSLTAEGLDLLHPTGVPKCQHPPCLACAR